MNIPENFAKACWRNWYRDYRVANRDKTKCDPWSKFWERRLRALEDYYRY
ncbi:hypothetical protein [Nostoc sp. CHAB 5715]|nr:hypothetical protein [Nostoc sp. CHAB 5715]MCC5620673.1 hypothetical protein [Nostoc sp. CHAB 5715]